MTGPYEHPMPGQVLMRVPGLDQVGYGEDDNADDLHIRERVLRLGMADVVTSIVDRPSSHSWPPAAGENVAGNHKPVLDIDIPAKLIPSSTEGHSHLYLDVEMPWPVYERLLLALAEAGVIEHGYTQASIDRRHTAVRLPWIRKSNADGGESVPIAGSTD